MKLFENLGGNTFKPITDEKEIRDNLISQISDDYKSLHGMRPRGMYQNLSIEELQKIADQLSQDIHADMEREKNDETQHVAATKNAMTPKKWTVGDVANLDEIHPDEIENFGDGYTNDSQRAFAHSQMTTPRHNDTDKANELAAQGKYVVMTINNAHCRSTDAVIGQHQTIHSVHDNNADAVKSAEEIYNSCDDVRIISPESIKSKEPVKSTTPDIDDVPFECVGRNQFKLK